MNTLNDVKKPTTKEPWVEPEVQKLDLSETAAANGVGSDGQTQFPDCTKS